MNKIIITLWYVLYASVVVTAQSYRGLKFHKLPAGISDNHITSILQDSKGFMWFGTDNGLNKFDGYAYTIYENDAADSSSITRNVIRNLYEDKSGNLWVSTEGGGLNYLDRKTNRFTIYKEDKKQLSFDIVRSVLQESNSLMWIVVKNGLNAFNFETKKFEQFVLPDALSKQKEKNAIHLLKVSPQYVWITVQNVGIVKFDKKTKKFITEPDILPENMFYSFAKSKQKDKFWIGHLDKGLSLISLENDRLTVEKNYAHDPKNPQSIAGNLINAICEDRQGRVWISIKDIGISLLNPQTHAFVLYQHNKKDKLSLSSNNITSIYEDRFGNVWIGNFGQGVNVVYNQYYQKFEHYYQDSENANSLSNNSANTFWETKEGKIWIGTDGGGITEWDRAKNTFIAYTDKTPPPLQISGNSILT
jgi:ligand-binding sensor domain-containing protein